METVSEFRLEVVIVSVNVAAAGMERTADPQTCEKS